MKEESSKKAPKQIKKAQVVPRQGGCLRPILRWSHRDRPKARFAGLFGHFDTRIASSLLPRTARGPSFRDSDPNNRSNMGQELQKSREITHFN